MSFANKIISVILSDPRVYSSWEMLCFMEKWQLSLEMQLAQKISLLLMHMPKWSVSNFPSNE